MTGATGEIDRPHEPPGSTSCLSQAVEAWKPRSPYDNPHRDFWQNSFEANMPSYNPRAIEPRWQRFWVENKTFRTPDSSDKAKYYILDMFPYPLGAGRLMHRPLHDRDVPIYP